MSEQRQIIFEIAEEAAQLIKEDRLDRAAFEALLSKARHAGVQLRHLAFLCASVNPTWIPEDLKEQWRLIPPRITNLICAIEDGWRPALHLGAATSLVGEGVEFQQASIEFNVSQGIGVWEVQCDSRTGSSRNTTWNMDDGVLVHNRLIQSNHEGGGIIRAEDAILTSKGHRFGDDTSYDTFTFKAHRWIVQHGHDSEPICWVAKITSHLQIGIGNVLLDRSRRYADFQHWSFGLSALRFDGKYAYYVLKTKNTDESEELFLIIDAGGASWADNDFQDLIALDFVFGHDLKFDIIYGISSSNSVVMARGVSRAHAEVRGNTVAVLPDQIRFDLHGPVFFSAISRALGQRSPRGLVEALFVQIKSKDWPLELQAMSLDNAIVGFSYWIVREETNEQMPTGESMKQVDAYDQVEKALQKIDLALPSDVLNSLRNNHELIQKTGVLYSKYNGNGTANVKNAVVYIGIMRSVLTAMIARSVGYAGPIAGYRGDSIPDWWKKKEDERTSQPRFLANEWPRTSISPPAGGLLLLVERPEYVAFLESLLRVVGMPGGLIQVVGSIGPVGLKDLVGMAEYGGIRFAVVASSNRKTVPSGVEDLKKRFAIKSGIAFPALREPASWLLADEKLVRGVSLGHYLRTKRLGELLPPEELSDPFAEAVFFFGHPTSWPDALSHFDAQEAGLRSPSLQHFLAGISQMLGHRGPTLAEVAARSISRDVIAALIREVMHEQTIAWKTVDGDTYTAERLSREIETGTIAGREYAKALLEISIDFLKRQSKKGKQ